MTLSAATVFSTRRLLLCAGCAAATAFMPAVARADDAEWAGPSGVVGDWFGASNWSGGVIPNDDDLYTWIGTGGTASLSAGQDATVRELYLGAMPDWSANRSGHMTIDNATLRARVLRLYGTSSLTLDNATLVSSLVNQETGPGIVAHNESNANIHFVSGSYDQYTVRHSGTGAVTVEDGVTLAVDNLSAVGTSGSLIWTQNGGSITANSSFTVNGWSGGSGEFILNAGQVNAATVEVGRDYHTVNSAFDGTGTINQHGGAFDTDFMLLYDLGRYNQHGGTLHVEDSLSGAGTLDFTGQNGTLTFGSQAQLNLRELTVLNAGSTTVTGGQNGVLYVAAGYDPTAAFGTFGFGGLVIEEGAPIHVQTGQNIVLSGTIDQQLLVEGAVTGDGTPLFLKGPTTIRGTVDISSDTYSQALIVDGHTSTMESGFGRFEAVVGDGAANSRLDLLGGDFAGTFLITRGVGGGTADVLIDGANGTGDNLQISVAGDGSAGARATITHNSGTLNINSLQVGDMPYAFAIYSRAGLNYPNSATGQSDNEYILSGDAVINVNEKFEPYWRTVGIGYLQSDGRFTQTGGTFNAQTAQVWLGRGEGITGTYDMDAGYLRAGEMYIGYHGTGRFYQDGGTVVVDGKILLGKTRGGIGEDPDTGEPIAISGGDGLYRINAGSLTAGVIAVSDAGVGVFEHNGGTVHAGQLNLGEDTQQSGLAEYRFTGGALSADRVRLGGGTLYRGKLIQTDGTADLGRLEINAQGDYELYGGTINLHGALVLNGGDIDFADGDATFHVADGGFANFIGGNIIGGENATLTGSVNSVISFEVGFDTTQFGTFTTEGLVHYGGDDLVIPFGLSVGAAGAFNGSIINYGELAPGSSPGKLSVAGSLTQSAGSELAIEIAGLEAGTEHDQIIASGTVSFNASSALDLSVIDGFSPELGDDIKIIGAGSLSGRFGTIQGVRGQPGLASNAGLAVSYNESTSSVWVTAALLGDSDLNETVSFADFNTLANNYNGASAGMAWVDGDFNGDGDVSFADFNILANNYGLSVPESASAAQADFANAAAPGEAKLIIGLDGSLTIEGGNVDLNGFSILSASGMIIFDADGNAAPFSGYLSNTAEEIAAVNIGTTTNVDGLLALDVAIAAGDVSINDLVFEYGTQAGSIQGVVEVVPEPSSLALLCPGGLLLLRRNSAQVARRRRV